MKLSDSTTTTVSPATPWKKSRRILAQWLVWSSILLLSLDIIYKTRFGITYHTRGRCVLYANLPRWSFLILEHIIELFLIVIVGVFVASLIEKHFLKIKRYIPSNPFSAFAAASIIPVCSCSAIPLIAAMRERITLRTIVTFVVAAPLLNPYILVLSVSVLGVEYAILRVLAAMTIAVSTGYLTELFSSGKGGQGGELPILCGTGSGCGLQQTSVFDATLDTLKRITPYLIVAGILGIAVDLLGPDRYLPGVNLSNNLLSTALVILIGVPVYFCNGADVLFLKPLLQNSYLPLGAAMAFSLTSTAICVTSLTLMVKYMGRRLTVMILVLVVGISFAISCAIDLLSGFT